ncbi:MAG TPA: Gfo/Idh/MocA family oxidoreductase [Hellea balneolensis]|uniref:Gfo/Idh/MocA family oxidoreductase n=1 Tax=Hellea balneolensis TaxID=287478 RepID=A0A7C5M1T9_9PROT|nr:Gfo/Idh/MocA family oxidoreductase [Hellea balneolensis]
MNPDSLKIGVIGAGVFGNYHAAKCKAHPRLDFIGIFDPDDDRVREVAKRHETQAYTNCNGLIAQSDALIVASPAEHHGPIALACLRAGRHVFVEKPIAADLESATTMVRLAAEQNVVLQIDHQERFVANAIGLDTAPETPTHIQAVRYGPKSERGTDVSVTLDLMTHDLDMVMWLMGGRPTRIEGEAVRVYSKHPDAARADLRFANGATARLEASRCESGPERQMHIQYPSGKLSIDFVAKTFKDDTGFGFNPDFTNDPRAKDSLGAAVDAFARSVLDGAPVVVSGEAGRDALEMALHIDGRLKHEIA